MNEEALAFGESGALFGILSLPAAPDPARPAVLIPNTGVEHRAGPGRLHVELARALAANGIAVLRFDNAGLGDSERVPGRAAGTAAPDLRAAMDALDARGFTSGYLIAGFHCGAHEAHQAARVDPRIAGALFVDGYAHRTPRYWLNRALEQLTQSKRYALAALRPLSTFTPQSGDALHDVLTDEIHWFPTPPRKAMQADLEHFVRRGLALAFVYTGEIENHYNYPAQLLDAFPLLRGYPKLTLRHLADGDHCFLRGATRETVVALVVDWVLSIAAPEAGPS